MKRAMRAVTVVGILAMLAAACGDDRPSSEELKAKVTEICQATGQRHEEASKGFDFSTFDPDTSDLTALIPLIEDNAAIGREAATELNKLRGPKADEEQIDQWIAIEDEIAGNAAEMIDAINSGDREQFKALAAHEEELLAEYGPEFVLFEGC
ncbi:MAG: hypothetical protein HY826_06090 [Actinobacteria bacterium]|nr:hypothetical protein [Actinomycetota bacterium]